MFYKLDIINTDEIESYGKKQGISPDTAKDVLKEDQDETIPAVFYKKMEEQLISNISLGRSENAVVYKLVGESSLLFPDEPLLRSTDTEGCLISRGLAWQMYGDLQVSGSTVQYDGQDFVIRGLLHRDDLVFVTVNDGENETDYMEHLIIKADSYRGKELYKERITQNCGIKFSEELTLYQRLHSIPYLLPNRMSNFSQWVDMFEQIFGHSG